MNTAKDDEIKEILTWMCCFMDADAVWSKKEQHLSTKALKRPTNPDIDLMVNKSLERICKLNPKRSKH